MARFAPLVLLIALTGCESGPHERIVHARFACDDGRNLQVGFNLDEGSASVRLSRKEALVLTHAGAPATRDYSGAGYRLNGVGDTITFASPAGSSTHCVETR